MARACLKQVEEAGTVGDSWSGVYNTNSPFLHPAPPPPVTSLLPVRELIILDAFSKWNHTLFVLLFLAGFT